MQLIKPSKNFLATQRVWIIGLCLCALVAPYGALGQSAFLVYSAAGPDPASITPTIDAFRSVLGTLNGNAVGSQSGGRREINWDGGGAAANATVFPSPMVTFNSPPTTRGAVFVTPGTGFEISGQPTPEFGDLNATYPAIFTPFSAPRLFTALGSNITDTLFFVPGSDVPAVVKAFGAVFTDVDLPESTSIEFFDASGKALGKVFVPPANNGLSFVGVAFEDLQIARVRITSGNIAPGPGAIDGGNTDVVVMDDFIYGEPSALIGPPKDREECKNEGWLNFNFPRTFKNQGDCIQFVNTGK
jgi:hypothetical protein